MEIEGVVASILYQNHDTEYCVLRLDNNIVVVGHAPFVSVGVEYKFVGEFVNKPVEGYTFYLEEDLIATTDVTGRFSFKDLKAGTYIITGSGTDYENYSEVFSLYDKKQILYIRIPSMSQLLDLADQALLENNLAEAESYVARALTQFSNNVEVLFYSAIVHFRKDEIDKFIELLHNLEQDRFNYPVIYFFPADIYQYKKSDTDTAKAYLQKYLALVIDKEQEKRLEDLQK